MTTNEVNKNIELQQGSLLRLSEFRCKPEEPSTFHLDITIIKYERIPDKSIIKLQGTTTQKCPFCRQVHDSVESYIKIEFSNLVCTCGSKDQQVFLTRLEIISEETQKYDFEASIVCKACKRFWPRIHRRINKALSMIKKLKISATKGEVEIEFQ